MVATYHCFLSARTIGKSKLIWDLGFGIRDSESNELGFVIRNHYQTRTTLKNQIYNWCVYGVYLHHNTRVMRRQCISLTEPNDEWLKRQIDNKEYSSKSELVNDLIRQARNQQQQIDLIRLKLDRAEKSGFTIDSKAEILKQSKDLLNG